MKNGEQGEQKEVRALEIAFTLGYTIVIPLVAGVLLGVWLDKKFQTRPLLLLSCVLVSIFLSSSLLVVKVRKYFE